MGMYGCHWNGLTCLH
uniref:Uncharacterized protein n=1 Tax=Anguilla anguilla TaxID=7936 RepID=A0A0E9QQJ2_ANGAN